MNTPDMKLVLCVTWFVGSLAFPLHAADLGPRDATMWLCEEWSLENRLCEGNPFDVVARVTFSHANSDRTRTTEMFYAGDGTWKFRFTGTRLGEWRFTTVSDDPELNGHSGTVTVRPNPDPKIKGFLTHEGNRFAIQTGDDVHLEAYRFNVYMNRTRFTGAIIGLPDEADDFQAYLNDAEQHGFDTVFVHVVNNWFRYGALKYSEHGSDNPDPRTFEALETAIAAAHRQGCRVHIWAWGDESREWTPIGVDGVNGPADRRLQRYVAARLGPLPGWSMGYGFDLHEWTKGSQLDDWSNYLHEHMGWDHLLCARGHRLPDRANNMNSYDGFGRGVELTTTSHGPSDYHEVVEDLDTDLDRPPANNIPTRSTGSLQRLRACSPAASHSLHSDHCSGHCQRHSELAIPGSPILRPVLQQQLDRRALFREYQLQTFSQKVQNVISSPKKAGISLGKKCFRNKIIGNVVEGGIKVVEADNVLEKNTLR